MQEGCREDLGRMLRGAGRIQGNAGGVQRYWKDLGKMGEDFR